MKKILMILTSHRLDCFRLAIDMLVLGGSAARFDKVVIMCSGVTGKHLRYVQSLPQRFPDVSWDFLYGPRGRGKPISDLQNNCVKKYPDALYFKLDEDTFVSRDWDIEIEKVYLANRDRPDLSLLSAVVTNNQRGAYHLQTTFPELGQEFTEKFKQPIVTERMGPVWILPQCAAFMIRRFLNLDKGNEELRAANRRAMEEDRWPAEAESESDGTKPSTIPPKADPTLAGNHQPFLTFSYPFSINCICFDYRHWTEIGGVPEEDENGWGQWIPANNKVIILVTDALVHHYSFFVQQNWLDRSALLEEIRRSNLPETYRPVAGKFARLRRVLIQVPGALARKFKKSVS